MKPLHNKQRANEIPFIFMRNEMYVQKVIQKQQDKCTLFFYYNDY